MREKIAHFNFELKWVAGKTHYIADALSRAPVFRPKEQLKETEEEARCLKIIDDPIINLIASAAGDIKSQRIISALQTAANPADLKDDHPAQPRQKLNEDKKPTDAGAPMEEIGVDYFDALGANWLVAVDRYSGYA